MSYKKHNPSVDSAFFDWREVDTTIDPTRDYSKPELAAIAEAILSRDARLELCPQCGQKETSEPKSEVVSCPDNHEWPRGEARTRGIRGDNPYLPRSSYVERLKKETYVESGIPDPSVESGIFSRPYVDRGRGHKEIPS